MTEYIANKKINGEDTAVRFVGYGKFVILKGNQRVSIPDEGLPEPAEKLFGEEFERVTEFRTFYDRDEKQFRLVEFDSDFQKPENYIAIPEDGGEIDGWMVGKIDKRSQLDDQSVQESE